MARTISINALLNALIGLLAVGLITAMTVAAYDAWERQRTADRVNAIAGVINPLFIALQNLRVERGTVNTALATAAPVDAGTRSDITAARNAAGPALAQAQARLGAVALPAKAQLTDALVGAEKEVAARRQAADLALGLPKEQRDANLSRAWIADVGKLVTAIDKLSEALSVEVELAHPVIHKLMTLKQLGWTVRDQAGTYRLRLGAAIAAGDKLSVERRLELAELDAGTTIA